MVDTVSALKFEYKIAKTQLVGELMIYRVGEKQQTRFRSKRHFLVGDQYYFTTREGVDIGPFSSKSELLQAIEYFKEIRTWWDRKDSLVN